MTKETKRNILIGIAALTVIGMFIPNAENIKSEENTSTKKEVVNNIEHKLNIITALQDHFYNKPLTKELLDKYPSFNEITKDFRKNGENTYYLYSKKYNIELQVKNNEVTYLWEGSRYKN